MARRSLLLLVTILLAGCAVNDAAEPELGTTRQPMVNGTTSTTAQDSTVFFMQGEESCSGTLIAPNLILTARHCIAEMTGELECQTFGPTAAASTIRVKVGVNSGFNTGTFVATGKKIFVPTTDSSCGFDVALIQLTADMKGAKVSPVRFTKLAANEPAVTVGYGVDENDQDLPTRMQRSTSILGVGPKAVSYKMKDGKTFTYETPAGDIVTGESTCFGDSGGPLFDMKGSIVGITSRGPFDAPVGGIHGENGCLDMLSVYAGTIPNEQLIRDAAKEAGHPLPAASAPEPQTTPGNTGDVEESTGDEDEDDTPSRGDDNDDNDHASAKKKKPASAAAASGCSSAPGRVNGASAWLALAGVALVLAARRRKTA